MVGMVKHWTKAAAALALCGAVYADEPQVGGQTDMQVDPAASRPNVLFILADDLGWRDTAVYGSSYYQTPHIDALAESGMRFTQANAASPLCSPTRASILTGQYPVRHGLTIAAGHVPGKKEHKERHATAEEIRAAGPTSRNYLDPAFYTLGEAMHDADYATGFFGKWHMGTQPAFYPENNGFDYVKGGRGHPGPPGKNPERKFYPPWNCDTLEPNPAKDIHVDDYITDLAIDYMKLQHRKGKPFFVCYWAYSVHSPYQSKPELMSKWRKRGVDPDNPQRSPTMGAMIEVFDDNVGRLLKAIDEMGLDQNTIVILTSDNGGNMYDTVDGTTPTNNYPLRNGKGNNYDGGVRVPLIVRWPGVTKPGSVNHDVISSVDHYPAILEMTGQTQRPDDHKDGVSYVPALKGESFDRGPTICDFPHPVWATYNIPNVSIRNGDWKLYRFWHDNPKDQSHRYELYNLKDDISETNNLAAKHPEQVKKLAAQLDQYYQQTGVLAPNPNTKYNRKTIGTWYAQNDQGSLAEDEGVLIVKAEKPGFAVRNRFFPNVRQAGTLVFEARSAKELELTFNSTGKKKNASITVTPKWQSFKLSGKDVALNRNDFEMMMSQPGTVELRDVKIVSDDGTVMMQYEFY